MSANDPALLEVNFSEEFARRLRKAAPRKHVPTALGIVIVIILIFLSVFHLHSFSREGTLMRNKRALDNLKSQAEEAAQFQQLHAQLEQRAAIFDAWDKASLQLAPRWLQLARLTPDVLYLSQIEFLSDDPLAGNQRLLLHGRALAPAGETAILRFLAHLKRDPLFSNTFATITLAAVSTEHNEKIFSIELSRHPLPPRKP